MLSAICRRRFSLYEELSVRRNLDLHARLYQMGAKGAAAVEEALQQFDLADVADTAPASLPLGIRQRLQLAAACLHHPEVLILDEPTSGVRSRRARYVLAASSETLPRKTKSPFSFPPTL